MLPTSEFDPRTVQPVASHYTDWAIIIIIIIILVPLGFKSLSLKLYNILHPPVSSSLLRPTIFFTILCITTNSATTQ
jgi:hypothetical protein